MHKTPMESFRLSPQQRHLCALQQAEEPFPYCMQYAVWLEGFLDVPRLRGALKQLVKRHEILRTSFPRLPGLTLPMQVINGDMPLSFVIHDCSSLSSREQEQALLQLREVQRDRSFPLEGGPLWQVTLVICDIERYWLLWDLSGLCADAQTCHVLLLELSQLFARKEFGEELEESLQYADLAEWQYQLLESAETATGREYWHFLEHGGLDAVSLPYELPTDGSSPFTPRSLAVDLSPLELAQLGVLAQQLDVAPAAWLLTCWGTVLSRLSMQTDLVIGTGYSGRNYEQLASAVGLLAKFLPLPCQFLEDAKLSEVTRQIEATMHEASKWQDYFGWEIFESLKMQGQEPFCPFGFDYETLPAPWQTGPLCWIVEEQKVCLERFKVRLSCQESSRGIQVILHYDQQRFAQEDMRRLLGHWRTVLRQVLVSVDVTVEDLQLLTHEERHQLLQEWNTTQADYPQDVYLHDLFEEQVKRAPEAVALTFEDEVLTYAELNRRANQLAYHLQGLGIGPDGLVGICMERCIEMVVGLLGVLKAGGAYVPLDPSYPGERLAFLLADSQVRILLTQPHIQEVLPPHQAQTLCVDEILRQQSQEQSVLQLPQQGQMDSQQLAYVIYTSGSTGQPKGAMNSHRAACNHLFWLCQRFALNKQDHVLQKTSFSFDASIWEFFAPLVSGARLVLAQPERQKDPSYLVEAIKREAITIVQFVPSMLQIFLGEPTVKECTLLRHVMSGGEVLSYGVQEHFFAQSGAALHNLYGPAEASVEVTHWECERKEEQRIIPIGRPISNIQIYVLDEQREPVPVRVTGELYIGGIGLGRGYWQHADLTAEKFVPHPWSQEEGARLYRTGDMARYLANGSIEFVGRRDQQVKVRGYRIELREIEATLMRHSAVREAVVLAREEIASDKRLVAYVVREGSKVLAASELRSHLQEKLPDYMIPTFFVLLEALPLTPNGKVDRRALPAPKESELRTDDWIAARTSVEEVVLAIYCEVLGMGQISIHDSFFDRGGHSLLAIQVISRIRAVMGVELSVRSLFETPSVAGLAEQIEQKLRSGQARAMPPLVPVTRVQDLPLSFAQQRLWFMDQLQPESTAYLSTEVLHFQGVLNVEMLERSLEVLVRRHEILRTTFTVRAGQPIQVIHPSGCYCLPLIDLRGLRPERRECVAQQMARQEIQRPCDLTTGPLLRTYTLRLETQEHLILLTQHHIITDGWSNKVLMRELSILYRAFVAEQPSPLAPLPIQYADYALWQRNWLQGEILETQLAYWRRQLAGITPLKLPTDRSRSSAERNCGAAYSFAMSTNLFEALVHLSSQEQVTMFMTLLAAFQTLLHHYSGQDDIVVGTDVANRHRVEIEGLIGFFVNQLVLRASFSGNPTFRELLKQVRVTTLQAYAYQDLPFEKLVEALQPQRSVHSSPLFQVKFLFDKAFNMSLEDQEALFPGAIVSREWLSDTTQIDLLLRLSQTPGDGLIGIFIYKTDVFEAATIERMAHHFVKLLEGISATPDARLDTFEITTEEERMQKKMKQEKHTNAALGRFNLVPPKPVRLHQEQLIQTSYLSAQERLPLVIHPQRIELDLVEWAKNNQIFIEAELHKHGALLFRDFSVSSPVEFEQFALALCPDLFGENGEHVPADVGSGNLYTPVFYAPEKKLLWHHENSFNDTWPTNIWFFCAQPADKGGETPIVDSRKVFQNIDPRIREQFMQKGIMYIRNYGEGLGLSWQTVFRTEKKEEVERYCQKAAIDFEWKEGDRLKTRLVRPAVLKHPQTRDWVWWNQATHWHPACLDKEVRASLLALFSEQDLPRNCCYGDGSLIEGAVMNAICEAYQEAEVSFPWKQGDILMLDNMLTAHARNPYEGQRKVYVSMGGMRTLNNL